MKFEEYCNIYKNPLIGDFLLRERLEREKITVKKVYIDVAGDIVAGLVLNQIVFWNSPDCNGDVHITVFKDGHLWLAKSRDKWWQECRLTPTQVDRALKHLEAKQLIVTAVYHFQGKKAKHARVNWEVFLNTIEDAKHYCCPKPGYKRREPTSGSGDNRSLRSKSTISENTEKSAEGENASSLIEEMHLHYQGKCIFTNSENHPYIYETFNETFNETNSPYNPPGDVCEEKAVQVEVVEDEQEQVVVASSTETTSRLALIESNQSDREPQTLGHVATKQGYTKIREEELQVFLDVYQAEKPTNFTNHRELSEKHLKSLKKLATKYKERSLAIFTGALIWCREQEGDWWRDKPLSLDNLMSNGKLVEFADKHFDAMESDRAYCDRVEGRAPSKDSRYRNGFVVTNAETGEELTGASAAAAAALADDPILQFMVGMRSDLP